MKKNILKSGVLTLLILTLSLSMLTACGGSDTAAEDDAPQGPDSSFLNGTTWMADTASQDGTTVDAKEVFNGQFLLVFSEDGKCTMGIDTQYALVDWTMNDDGSVTLSGDNTYEITFPEGSQTELIAVINGIDVHMVKWEDEDGEAVAE